MNKPQLGTEQRRQSLFHGITSSQTNFELRRIKEKLALAAARHRPFDDVDGVVREQDFADVAEQDVGCRLVNR